MNQKFGGGRKPTGTPSLALSCVVVVVSLLTGASVVHNIYKPDLMCQKQCCDENGFKCHCMSESHQRQMKVFGQNPNRIIDGYSEEFESNFLEHMKRSHRRLQRVHQRSAPRPYELGYAHRLRQVLGSYGQV
ncbi:hypothetical protein FEM48_Zijuj03G0068800 [Ziziphus jujuba var. spinosa]|uniref:DNA/RNA-binding protein Kin17 WH-like domain-containing protein n=1 Tax=Ziziphus jujuba var. spinosa TaxID=714518 RepID=A0A978VNT8_ZIZJJ|nr:hypothetical protein FEM48_Zijuj03G0068800 [Ziziphus jujuba var. spinosa]